jgi:uracil-DNA glycosylase family 4
MDDLAQRQAQLDSLAEMVRVCVRCKLCETRKNAVPGEGPVDARIMFIGEGPGANEDQTGRPFVGAAGQLLERLLATIGLTREDVYIANVVKCRPPMNRDPEPDEIEACKPYLGRQLKIIDPDIIVTLGRFAMERWLPDKKISRVHGQNFRYGSRMIVPLFHPAAALRRPEWQVALEEDFLRLPDYVEEAHSLRTVLVENEDEAPPPQQSRLL